MWPMNTNPIDFHPSPSKQLSDSVIVRCSESETPASSMLPAIDLKNMCADESNDSFRSDRSITDLEQLHSSELSDIAVTDLSDFDNFDAEDLEGDVAMINEKAHEKIDHGTETDSSYTTSSDEEVSREGQTEERKKLSDECTEIVEILSSSSTSYSKSKDGHTTSSSSTESEIEDPDTTKASKVPKKQCKKANTKDKAPHKYFCSQCGKTYSRIFNMKRHERYECGVKGEHTCGTCGKTYSLKRNLSRHEKYECGRKLPKEFICTMCGKTFCRKGSLTRHEQNECGKEPHIPCPYCKHKSKRDDHLFEHIRKCHFSIAVKKKVRRAGTKKSEKKQQEIERRLERQRMKDAARNYGCERCGKRYTLHRTLRSHEKMCGREKSDEFFCGKCNKRFFWKGNLTRHEKFECGKDLFHDCLYCPYKTKRTDILSHHQSKCHQNPLNMMKSENLENQLTATVLTSQQHFVARNQEVATGHILNAPVQAAYTLKMGSSSLVVDHIGHDISVHPIPPNMHLKSEMNELKHC